jgi:predicted NBD/HSP70 family sugar kinase
MIFSEPKTARMINRLRVLNCIQQLGSASRADLSRELVINKVSISEIVLQLLEEGMVEESEKTSGSIGRRPTPLRISRGAGYVLAVDAGGANTASGIALLNGDLVRFQRQPTPAFSAAGEKTAFITETVRSLTGKCRDPRLIKGCAVSLSTDDHEDLPGSQRERTLQYSAAAKSISQAVGIPVVVDSSVRSMLLGEIWFSDLPREESVFYISWGRNIKAAVLSQERINPVESEFGHLDIGSGLPCRCGKKGCLESSAAGWALEQRTGALQELLHGKNSGSADHSEARTLAASASRAMGTAAAAAAAVLCPDRIIIGGGLSALDDSFYRIMNETFGQKAAPGIRSSLVISRTALGERSGILGAAAAALDTFVYKRRELYALTAAGITLLQHL